MTSPDYELAHITDLICAAYARVDQYVALLHALGSEEFKDSDKKLSARLLQRSGFIVLSHGC